MRVSAQKCKEFRRGKDCFRRKKSKKKITRLRARIKVELFIAFGIATVEDEGLEMHSFEAKVTLKGEMGDFRKRRTEGERKKKQLPLINSSPL